MDTGLTPHDARPTDADPSDDRVAEIVRGAWRELGFWYDCDTEGRRWLFRADRRGIAAFATEVRNFLGSPEASELGEHVHLGPYSSLRLTCGARPEATWKGIAGTREDFAALAAELDDLAGQAGSGERSIGTRWQKDDSYRLVLMVEQDGFDPASAAG